MSFTMVLHMLDYFDKFSELKFPEKMAEIVSHYFL